MNASTPATCKTCTHFEFDDEHGSDSCCANRCRSPDADHGAYESSCSVVKIATHSAGGLGVECMIYTPASTTLTEVRQGIKQLRDSSRAVRRSDMIRLLIAYETLLLADQTQTQASEQKSRIKRKVTL